MIKDCWHGDYLSHADFMKIEKGDGVVCSNCLILISRYSDHRLHFREVVVALRVH